MSEVKAVVVAESINTTSGRADMIWCLGAFDNFAEAYGEGLIHLSGMADEDNTITPIFDLEGETGFGFSLKNKDGQETDTVFVLYCEETDEQKKGAASHE